MGWVKEILRLLKKAFLRSFYFSTWNHKKCWALLLTALLFLLYNFPANNILCFVVTCKTGTLCRKPISKPSILSTGINIDHVFKTAFYSKDPQRAGNFTQTIATGHYYYSLQGNKEKVNILTVKYPYSKIYLCQLGLEFPNSNGHLSTDICYKLYNFVQMLYLHTHILTYCASQV